MCLLVSKCSLCVYMHSVTLAGQVMAGCVGLIETWTAGQTMTWGALIPSAER